jgi:hypothetical protein
LPTSDGRISHRDLCNEAVQSRTLDTTLESDDYVSGSAGWQINRETGNAEFNNVTVRGDVVLDAGSTFKSDDSGNRVEIAGTDPDTLAFFSGFIGEDNSGLLQLIISGAGGAQKYQMSLSSPSTTGANTAMSVNLVDATVDDSTDGPNVTFAYSGTSAIDPELRLQNKIQVKFDADASFGASRPSWAWGGDEDSGAWRVAADEWAMGAGGVEAVRIKETGAASQLGFHATTPIGKPTVSGSRGGNAALASLLTELANYGLITDSSS